MSEKLDKIENGKKVRFDPERYRDRANSMLSDIKKVYKQPGITYNIVPCSDTGHAFESIQATMPETGHSFTVTRTPANKKLGQKNDKLYVSVDNLEFLDEGDVQFNINIVALLDQFINDTYVFDLNSKQYVRLPKEVTFWERLDRAFSSKNKEKTR